MELRELAAAPSYWLMLAATGVLVAQAFAMATSLYAEASGIGGGPAALAQGLSPLDGVVVPTLGAYDLVSMLLLPFVVIRMFAADRRSGALTLGLQLPVPLRATIAAKTVAVGAGWLAAGVPAALALGLWSACGGHLYAPEVLAVALGHGLRGFLTIGIGAAAAALAASPASAAIVALSITIGTWAIDYVAAARGGWFARVAELTPAAALRVFEHGDLRTATVALLLAGGAAGLAVAAAWLHVGRPLTRRVRDAALAATAGAALVLVLARLPGAIDLSESRRNSLPAPDEAAVRALSGPLRITVHLAAEDPRLTDFERGALGKLRRIRPDLEVVYAARGRTGLFEGPGEHYGEIAYEAGGAPVVSRSVAEPIVLEAIYEAAGRSTPAAADEAPYPGYPLAVRFTRPAVGLGLLWPLVVGALWWWWWTRGASIPERSGGHVQT